MSVNKAALQAEPEIDSNELPGMWDRSDLVGGETDCTPQPAKVPEDMVRALAMAAIDVAEEETGKTIWPKSSDEFSELLDVIEDSFAEKLADFLTAAPAATQPAKVPEWFMAKMDQHALSAGECPPRIKVVPLYSIRRLASTTAPAAIQPDKVPEDLIARAEEQIECLSLAADQYEDGEDFDLAADHVRTVGVIRDLMSALKRSTAPAAGEGEKS